jgi:hypothetical protein
MFGQTPVNFAMMHVVPTALQKILTATFISLALIESLLAIAIRVEGRAAGDLPNARETALADALREAVRQGTGVDVLASSGTADFTLEYDRVLASAFGHVKSFRVLGSRLGADGIYRVEVEADVGQGAPSAKSKLAMRELLLRINSPRLSVRIHGSAGEYATALIEEAARELQIQTVPPGAPCEFEIVGEVSLNHKGRQTLHGSPPRNVFAARGSIRAVRGDTGDVVASDNLATLREIGSSFPELPDAEQDALERALRPQESDGIPPILGKVIARWVTETDLGAMKRLEFSGISSDDFQKIQTDFADTEKISAVWPREFDSQGLSVLDVETRVVEGVVERVLSFQQTTGGARLVCK